MISTYSITLPLLQNDVQYVALTIVHNQLFTIGHLQEIVASSPSAISVSFKDNTIKVEEPSPRDLAVTAAGPRVHGGTVRRDHVAWEAHNGF